MNCDKKFLGTLRLETGGYTLGLLHFGASIAVLVLYLNHLDRINLPLWGVVVGSLFWIFHFFSSVFLLVGTAKRKSTLLIPFIILYTIIFTIVATFVAFLVLEIIATTPKPVDKKANIQQRNSTQAMKNRMRDLRDDFLPKLKLEKEYHLLLILIVTIVCIICVYILSCICSLYDKLKECVKEERSLPVLGNIVYGAVRKSESSES